MTHDDHNCVFHEDDRTVMCDCKHNPGGECHCEPLQCKCDGQHHLEGKVQLGHHCCATGVHA